ncbi:hypothetical protein NA56DRAFT_477194 [Hyaloscypha hepaticicola]|uniref:Uncharacterized protein n=1 Tax=Hyaloscypha hepaticicola TaxID=2082293 RepID=A0A2J6PFB7_9HELO|nr:hypothetical protein NA56DRAFT_477194 [Hyaloscypha hepaticicola]
MCYEYFCRYENFRCFHCTGIDYCKAIKGEMAKVKPTELYLFNRKSCVYFKYFDHRCELDICEKHLKQTLEKGGNDMRHEGNVDMDDGKKSKDAVGAEEGCEGPEILAEIVHEEKCRNKVLEWFTRYEKLERMTGK